MATNPKYTVPGMTPEQGGEVAALLQDRLHAYNDLHLTLKHAHWNVVGPNFISVHEMIDPQVEAVRGFADAVAERIATLGGSPKGTPGSIVAERQWEDYSIGRDTVIAHLAALDVVYQGVISSVRDVIAKTGELDPITEDMLIGQSAELELFHWFVRAHLENSGGALSTGDAKSEKKAAARATS
ncbi:DNA starvation/stationary phase protection protein [Rhodococcus antarcticus]|jgi:starvation-inducible DNA-binding protein|uniref:DNA starvation/stationary phase protection protein n=1 Tax=Rhodococcus antarcticus TaxID=2987751 RepID=A0ABY6NY47_9NOCA|nr:DNA starvation/stationary phase protection protein [Rhodococcus antarcticus]UZJ23951.1 DNA starvation/stationary phase protection protein [Rhodococcus antarcticus]